MTLEVSARRVNEAIEEGLLKLNKTIDEVDVKILSQGGLFRKAKVLLTVIGEEEEVASKPVTIVKADKPVEREDKTPIAAAPKKERPQRQEKRQPAPRKENEAEKREPAKREPAREETVKPKREERPFAAITPEVESEAVTYATSLVKLMGVDAEIKTEIKDGGLLIDIVTENSAVIGYRGEALDAIEYLVSLAVNKNESNYYKLSVNSNGYREKREKMLVELANKMAAKCIKQNRKVVLEPMNSNFRKIIHAALSDNDKVITRSEGHEPNRRVVIFAVRNKKQ